VIVKTRYAGNRAVESRDVFSSMNTSPSMWRPLALSSSGQVVTVPAALGLPALGAAVRLVSGTIAALRFGVYQGRRGDKKERDGSWQAALLAQPTLEGSSYDWMWDIATSLEATENAVLQKIKKGRRVVELKPVDIATVRIYRNRDGVKVIEVGSRDGAEKYTTKDFLHIRGQTMGAGVAGVSRIWQHRDPAGAMLAAQKFVGKFFQNDARPGVAFIFPDNVRREQAAEWKTDIETEYGGADNAWKPFVAGGGVQIQAIPVSLQDAQFVEGRKLSVLDCARILDVDPGMLGEATLRGERVEALNHFLAIQLPPRLARIEYAFKADPDLFGTGPLYPAFDLHDLTYIDPLTRAQIVHEKIQDGTLLVDEARAEEGLGALPPVPDDWKQTPGAVPQIVPVGGGPNPDSGTPPPAPQR
jgi:HK97 family phage portal protein